MITKDTPEIAYAGEPLDIVMDNWGPVRQKH